MHTCVQHIFVTMFRWAGKLVGFFISGLKIIFTITAVLAVVIIPNVFMLPITALKNILRGRMQPLAPYYPALVILAGTILVALGGLWAAKRQANFNATLNDKNNAIILLQHQQIMTLIGGDSYPYIMPALSGKDHHLELAVTTEGNYTIYDLQVTILDQNLFSSLVEDAKTQGKNLSLVIGEIHSKSQGVFPIGNTGPNQERVIYSRKLDPNVGHYGFLVNFVARNGAVTEFLKLFWVNNSWAIAYRVMNQSGVLKELIPNDFPKTELWK